MSPKIIPADLKQALIALEAARIALFPSVIFERTASGENKKVVSSISQDTKAAADNLWRTIGSRIGKQVDRDAIIKLRRDAIFVALNSAIRFLKKDIASKYFNKKRGLGRYRDASTVRDLCRHTGTRKARADGWKSVLARILAASFDRACISPTGTFRNTLSDLAMIIEMCKGPGAVGALGFGKTGRKAAEEVRKARKQTTEPKVQV